MINKNAISIIRTYYSVTILNITIKFVNNKTYKANYLKSH